jgi:hypothetical protein
MRPPAALQAVAVSTTYQLADGRKAFEVMLLGGPEKFYFVSAFIAQFQNIAREQGCAKVSLVGPPRLRRLPPGWWPAATIYDFDLDAKADVRTR